MNISGSSYSTFNLSKFTAHQITTNDTKFEYFSNKFIFIFLFSVLNLVALLCTPHMIFANCFVSDHHPYRPPQDSALVTPGESGQEDRQIFRVWRRCSHPPHVSLCSGGALASLYLVRYRVRGEVWSQGSYRVACWASQRHGPALHS